MTAMLDLQSSTTALLGRPAGAALCDAIHTAAPDLLRDELLHELFEARADARPTAVAVECADECLTYRGLESRANQVARELRARGVTAGDRVGLLVPRSCDLYVAMLGILKAGAAYVPLDVQYPPDRLEYILGNSAARLLVTTEALAREAPAGVGTLLLDADWPSIARHPGERLTRSQVGAGPRDICYVIYTSGSTGKPKGVPIEHRSVCHFVRAEGRMFGVKPEDRVYQGFTVAFDASVEEIWLALFAGATLVVPSAEVARSGPGLSQWMTEARVSVFSAVPTLLSMMEGDVPTLRLLIVGGENCSEDLVRRWWRPDRRIVNTYGPTETTVVATWGELHPQHPVTIGRALPNFSVRILDEQQRPVAAGATGEIYIGGVGLSPGYVGNGELTAQRFIADPQDTSGASRLYRTGDLARYTPDGDIQFVGRADGQVKLRGFRIELGEIESALLECPAVQAAAANVRQEDDGVPQLVAWVIARDHQEVEARGLREHLRQRLPSYMIPSLFEKVVELPLLPCGKIDRARLPRIGRRATAMECEAAPVALTSLEATILAAWRKALAPAPVGPEDDFFLDLGGHSLLAAVVVSRLREDARFADLSVVDVYNHSTVRRLAAELDARGGRGSVRAGDREAASGPRRAPVSRGQYLLTCLGQLPGLYVVLGFLSSQWLAPFLAYGWAVESGHGIVISLAMGIGMLLGLYPAMLIVAVATKWLILGRIRPGEHRVWGSYFLRWWLAQRILAAVHVDYLAGTPLLAWYYRMLGARIGRRVYLNTDNIAAFDLLSIGDNSSVGEGASLLGYTVENGLLKIAPIEIGQRCFVGARSVLCAGAAMEDDAALSELSMLPGGSRIPAGQTWIGSPARPADRPREILAAPANPSRLRSAACTLGHAAGAILIPATYLCAIFPAVVLLNHLSRVWGGYWFLVATPVAGVSFVILLAGLIALVKWVLLGRVRPGSYPLASWFYLRKWFCDQLMEVSLDVLGPLYATLYLAPWYRLLGARIGRRAEISTASSGCPDLLAIDDEAFVADAASLGTARVEGGVITLAPTTVGRRSFIGNSALVPGGSDIADNCLIGVLSAPPQTEPGARQPDTSWLGSPAIFLPQRQASATFAEQATFRPTRWVYMQRLVIEFFRITLPPTFFVFLSCILIKLVMDLSGSLSLVGLIAIFPALHLLCGLGAAAIVIAAKWMLLGRYKPAEKPLWSTFVWRTELLTALHEHLADPFLTSALEGTPLICIFFRLLGSRIGSRVYMETSNLTEFDLIHIGDGATLGAEATIQTHLFEDRVMKMGTIEIGAGCSIGAESVVLYDTRMEDGAGLGELSLLMKGEVLPPATQWLGTPAQRG